MAESLNRPSTSKKHPCNIFDLETEINDVDAAAICTTLFVEETFGKIAKYDPFGFRTFSLNDDQFKALIHLVYQNRRYATALMQKFTASVNQ